jgi:hypothetical protein
MIRSLPLAVLTRPGVYARGMKGRSFKSPINGALIASRYFSPQA